MKILLVNPSDSAHQNNFLFQKIFPPVPPLSILYLASYLEDAKYSVEIFDMFVESGTKKNLLEKISDEAPQPVKKSKKVQKTSGLPMPIMIEEG